RTAARVEPDAQALRAVGYAEVPRRIHRRALGLDEEWRSAGRRRTPCEQLGPPAEHPIHDPDLPVAIEGGDEELAPRAHRGHLSVEKRRAVEVLRLHGRGQPRAPERDPIEGPQILDLA